MNKVGFIISIENYISSAVGLKEVQYANNDAKIMKDIFITKLGISEENIYEFIDDKGTFANCGSSGELAYYMSHLDVDTTVYFYYAGHGFFYNGDNYLTVYDTSTLDLTSTSIAFNGVLMNIFRKSGANRFVGFIDACAEGLSNNSRGVFSRGFDFNSFSTQDSFKYAILFSCSPNEKSISSDELKHGVWTYYLSKAMNEDVFDALNERGSITTSSLHNYLLHRVSAYVSKNYTNQTQTPYAAIATNSDIELVASSDEVSFEECIRQLYEELNNKCYLVNVILGDYDENSVIDNPAIMESVCWEISERLPDDWSETFNELIYLVGRVQKNKSLNIPYEEQQELKIRFNKFLQAIVVEDR